MIILCAAWGMAVMAYNVTFQSELILCVPQSASAVAMIALAALIYYIIRLIRHMKRMYKLVKNRELIDIIYRFMKKCNL